MQSTDMTTNLILNTDSYKASHFLQYPPGTEYVSSYIESRAPVEESVLFFGLQMFMQEYLTKPISETDIDEAELLLTAHGVPFHRAGWEYILNHHQGYLPIAIEAVPEGCMIPSRQVLVQVVNTDPACAWLTSYIETALLRAVWYPSTVATVSKQAKQIIELYLQETADSTQGLPFKLHDFGARGASSEASAAIGGAAHLVNFQGSDTLSGVLAARRYYDAEMAGFSIPAAEHSTVTAWGRENEASAYRNMIVQFGGEGRLYAVVSDSYDLWHTIDNLWGQQLKDELLVRGGTLVVRPDSGDPVTVVVETIERLMARFGEQTNQRGYRVLPDSIRVIQGDGVSVATIDAILSAMKAKGLSADNIAFGMGAELLQKVNRDTYGFAMKASAIQIDGQWRDVYKDPVTDQGKRSKRGRLALVRDERSGNYETLRETELAGRTNLLQTVFRNGRILKRYSFAEVRANSEGD